LTPPLIASRGAAPIQNAPSLLAVYAGLSANVPAPMTAPAQIASFTPSQPAWSAQLPSSVSAPALRPSVLPGPMGVADPVSSAGPEVMVASEGRAGFVARSVPVNSTATEPLATMPPVIPAATAVVPPVATPTAMAVAKAVGTTAATPTGTAAGYGHPMVQVMTLSNKQDADAMVAALKRHGYNVAVNRDPADTLLHLEVGPFASKTDAEAMRARLVVDGYNATIK
jgi:cell division septation protein DedD